MVPLFFKHDRQQRVTFRDGFLRRLTTDFGRLGKGGVYTLIAAVALLLLVSLTTRFNFTGHLEGIFLLKGKDRYLLELKDDLYLGDGSRLILSFDPDAIEFLLRLRHRLTHKPGEVCLDYAWHGRDGSGYVRNYLPGGRQLVTFFSRFTDDSGAYSRGLFVGGGLPGDVKGDDSLRLSETGMAYFDGKRWYHIWCNANEGLASGTTMKDVVPSTWRFLGSKVINEGHDRLAITSSHVAVVDGVPLRVDRFAYFTAGEPYFILTINIKNTGDRPVSYVYCYGDEPWLGEFGSSKGNVGWVKDQVIDYAQWVDNYRYSYAGLYDYGNDAIGEGHNFAKVANFIEWLGDNVPMVYFSNGPADFPRLGGGKVPLASNTRFIGLQWGPQELKPGQSERYALAIGMAGYNPKTDLPVKPRIKKGCSR
jgi:hypothetical protein